MNTRETSSRLAQQLFLAVIELPEGERRAFLDSRCSGEQALRQEVESLLEHHDPSSEFLQRPAIEEVGMTSCPASDAAEHAEHAVGTLAPGVRVGPYTIRGVLGAGGMGVVYSAEQDNPRRLVALKLMRAGLISRSALRRFEHEATALARLNHPCIARVYEAGTDARPDGVRTPYLALELVEGQALGRYMKDRTLGTPERLAMFVQLCEAVAHAHQRGVIHRDLKPANVMVEPAGGIKVLDFGIARLVGGTDHPATAPTQAGPMPGTLGYMSPEQLGSDPLAVDVRTDVYALGVILYEMLGGRLPVEVTRLSFFEAAKAVRTAEPPPLGSLNRACRGDLENIAAKALEKDPSRRYPSAAELAEDVRRHLRNEPILARPAGAGYRTGKFVRRHRVLVAATSAVFLALGAGLGTSVWQAYRAAREADRATRQARTAQAMSGFLREIFETVDPERARGEEPKVRELLDSAAERLNSAVIDDPLALAELHETIGAVYGRLGEAAKAEKHQREAFRLYESANGKDCVEALGVVAQIAWTMHNKGRPYDQQPWYRDAMEKAIAATGPDSKLSIELMTAVANSSNGRTPESDELYLRAYERSRRTLGPKDPLTLRCMSNLCYMKLTAGEYADSLPLADECYALHREILGSDSPRTLTAGHNVAVLRHLTGDSEKSADLLNELLDIGDRVLGPAHMAQVQRRANAAGVFLQSGRFEDGLRHAEISVANARGPDGAPTQRTVQAMGIRTSMLIYLKRYALAEQSAQETLDTTSAIAGGDPEKLVQPWSLFYDLYEATGDAAKQAEYRAKIASTKTGRRMLDAEGSGASP